MRCLRTGEDDITFGFTNNPCVGFELATGLLEGMVLGLGGILAMLGPGN